MNAIDELIIDFDIDKPHAMRTRHGMAKNARAELSALLRKVATLQASCEAHEEDCAVLPEDCSVTEYVTQLCAKLAALRAMAAAGDALECRNGKG